LKFGRSVDRDADGFGNAGVENLVETSLQSPAPFGNGGCVVEHQRRERPPEDVATEPRGGDYCPGILVIDGGRELRDDAKRLVGMGAKMGADHAFAVTVGLCGIDHLDAGGPGCR